MNGPGFRDGAALTGASLGQVVAIGLAIAAMIVLAVASPHHIGLSMLLAFQIGFLIQASWNVLMAVVSLTPIPHPPTPATWPRYTILVALHDEADVTPQLIERLSQIDYPADRLECFLLLEAHDQATITVAEHADRPSWMQVMVVPPGSPKTKPRALNYGLERSRGDIVTIYDAEDDPDPLQLREAAARFACDDDGRLVCLQAPLRIRRRHKTPGSAPIIDRQFAAEYAALFEVTLPAMARMGLPFPLGGTSNHFRADVLRRIGGWDAHNVTEDADLGFRLWRAGGRMGVITRPTYETPPGGLETWLPQRTRWIKGYMQTWGVHTRNPAALGWRGALALVMTLGAALTAAAVHALSLAWVAACALVAVLAWQWPESPQFSLTVLLAGVMSAWLRCAIGARRAHTPYHFRDMLLAPVYWALLSLAFVHAVWRLIREPHAWDKTPHRRDEPETVLATEQREAMAPKDCLDAGRQAA